jgi:hypothetical protein
MNILIVDDQQLRHYKFIKDYPNDNLFHAYNFDSATKLLDGQKFDLIMLDHDLGDYSGTFAEGRPGKELTGYDVALYLVRVVPDTNWPEYVMIHTLNNVAAWDIKRLLNTFGIKSAVRPFKFE